MFAYGTLAIIVLSAVEESECTCNAIFKKEIIIILLLVLSIGISVYTVSLLDEIGLYFWSSK